MDTEDLMSFSDNDENSWDADENYRNDFSPETPKDFSAMKVDQDDAAEQLQRDREAKLNQLAYKAKRASLKASIKQSKTGDKDIAMKKMDNKKYKSLELSTLLAFIMGVKAEDKRAKEEDKVLKKIANEKGPITSDGKPITKAQAISKIKQAMVKAKAAFKKAKGR